MVLNMGRKKAFLLFIFSVLIMSLLPYAVSAQEDEEGIGEGLASAFNTIKDMFSFLPEMLNLEKLTEGDAAALFWAKFLVWLLLFSITYFGAGFLFQQNKNVTIAVAFGIALMGALLIPNPMLVDLFKTYGFLSAVIIWMAPVLAGMLIAEKITIPLAKAVIYIITLGVVIGLNKALVQNYGLDQSKFPWFGLVVAVLIILSIVNLFRGAWPGGGSTAGGWAGRAAGWGWNQLTRPREDGGLLGGRREPRNEEEARRREEQETEQQQRLNDLNSRLENARTRLSNEVRGTRGQEMQDLQIIRELLNELLQIEGEIRNMLTLRR